MCMQDAWDVAWDAPTHPGSQSSDREAKVSCSTPGSESRTATGASSQFVQLVPEVQMQRIRCRLFRPLNSSCMRLAQARM